VAGHIYPPRRGDSRIVDFITAQGGSSTGDINRDFAEALALALGFTAAQRNDFTIDDLWKRYKVANGITDTSEPFDLFGLLENYLLEGGDDLLKEDGSVYLLE
jgi:hypothetical protein